MKTLFAAAVMTCMMLAGQSANAQASECGLINGMVLEGKAQSLSFLQSVRDPLACIVPQISRFEPQLQSTEKSPQDLDVYLSLTAASILLVEASFNNVTRFRDLDSIDVARTLAVGAGHPDRAVRLNSARLLASVVDNSTLCVVLDQLHQPVSEDPTGVAIIKRANLLGVARGAASWISRENQQALAATLDFTKRNIGLEFGSDLSNTRALITDIDQRLRSNSNGSSAFSELVACNNPELYEYWIPANYDSQPAEMNENPFLPLEVQEVVIDASADIRFCYQEFRGESGRDSYLVACHETVDLCNKAKVNPGTTSSECRELDVSKIDWSPGRGGLFDSLFQYSDTEFPDPFPRVPM